MSDIQNSLGVLATLAVLGVTLWWLRRKGAAQFAFGLAQGQRAKRMKAVERLSLTPQHSLHLVEVEGRTLLVAAGPGGCSILESVASERERSGAK